MTHVSGYPLSLATSASEMPVLPLVGSRSSRPGSSSPAASAASIIALATRSLIEPVGFCPSSFAYSRTLPTGLSSTRGVLPTSSSSECATVLGIPLPDVDRRTELAEELVDPPELPAGVRRDAARSMAFEELGLATLQAGQTQEIAAGVPASVLDHALAPLASELRGREKREARRRGAVLHRGSIDAFRNDRNRGEEPLGLAGLEELGRERDVDQHASARAKDAGTFGEPASEVDVHDHVAAPDPVGDGVGQRHRLHSGLEDRDLLLESGSGDCATGKLDVEANRVERDGLKAVIPHEANRVRCVARTHVDDQLAGAWVERRKRLEQRLRAARIETLLELEVERFLACPELLVELLD